MTRQTRAWLVTPLLCLLAAVSTQAQWCQVTTPANLETDYRVIDARPSEVNKVRGRSAFKKKAQIAIINMNPFMFKYDIKLDQTPIEDRAQLDFLKLLGAPITDLAGIASFTAVKQSKDAETLETGGDLRLLIWRTGGESGNPPNPAGTCATDVVPAAELALRYLADTRNLMLRKRNEIERDLARLKVMYRPARDAYLSQEDILYSPSSSATEICGAANTLMASFLVSAPPAAPAPGDPQRRRTTYPTRDAINMLEQRIGELESLILELKKSAKVFKADSVYSACQARLSGFDYADSLISLAEAMEVYLAAVKVRAQAFNDETKAYDFLVRTIKTFAQIDAFGNVQAGVGPGTSLLQKTFEIAGQYDASSLDIEVIPSELQPLKPFHDTERIDTQRAKISSLRNPDRTAQQQTTQQVINGERVTTVGDLGDGASGENASLQTASVSSRRTNVSSFAQNSVKDDSSEEGGEEPAPPLRTKANATIGSRRFELSGGMVYSTLDRREFQPVLGFARDTNGNIVDSDGKSTDKRDLTTIVGVSESSKSRFSPLVMLNTRLSNYPKYNLFFSVGVTAKGSSTGTDVEYLLGPSFNFLNKNAFFTFGAYAGRQQKLAGDLFVGARLNDKEIPVNKEYKWAPAFAFTYRIPVGSSPSK